MGARLCTQLLRRLEVWKPPSAVPVTLDGPVGKLGTNQTTPVLAAFKRTMSEGHWGQRHLGLVDSRGPGWGTRRTQRAPGRGTTFWPKPSSHLPTSWWPSWNHLELSCPFWIEGVHPIGWGHSSRPQIGAFSSLPSGSLDMGTWNYFLPKSYL